MDPSLSHVSVEDIESALNQVAEVKAARVVASPDGDIQEIHVLALPTKSPKQLVRDIESTIMARFGVPVDHRKISIAQLGQEALPSEPSAAPTDNRARIVSINAHVSGVHASVAVVLHIEGEDYTGQASGPASQTVRTRLVAQATLDAVEQYAHGSYSFALEDVAVIPLGRERVAVACVTLVSPLGEHAYAGSALVRTNDKDSIVRATLDAINRRLGFLTTS